MNLENLEIVEIQDVNSSKKKLLKKKTRYKFVLPKNIRFRFSKNSIMFGTLLLIEEELEKINNR